MSTRSSIRSRSLGLAALLLALALPARAAATCPSGQYPIGQNPDGSLICQPDCPAGQVKTGQTAAGAPICGNATGQSDTSFGTGNGAGSGAYKALSAKETIAPNLEIPIPNLAFTPILASDNKLSINWIAEYVQGVYRYLLGFSVTVAIVFIMIGGLQYVLAAGTGNTKAGKEKIQNAVIGLILLIGTYLILYGVGGARLVNFSALTLQRVQRQDLPPSGESENDASTGPELTAGDLVDLRKVKDSNIQIACSDCLVGKDVAAPLQAVAQELRDSVWHSNLKVTSAVRTIDKQAQVYYDKCISGGKKACSPQVCLPVPKGNRTSLAAQARSSGWTAEQFIAAVKADAAPDGCPHTARAAVDVWCDDQYQFGNYTFKTDCQAALTQIMEKHGFCRLNIEPWHFELDSIKASKDSCTTGQDPWSYKKAGSSGTIYNFQTCDIWNAVTNTCQSQKQPAAT